MPNSDDPDFRDALAAWDSTGLGAHTAVHAVQCRPVLAVLLEARRVPMAARRAAEAITHGLTQGQRHWTRHDFATWFVSLQQPDGTPPSSSPRTPRGGKLRGGDGNRQLRSRQQATGGSDERERERAQAPLEPFPTGGGADSSAAAEEWALQQLGTALLAAAELRSHEARSERTRELVAKCDAEVDEAERAQAERLQRLRDETAEWEAAGDERRRRIRDEGQEQLREQAAALQAEAIATKAARELAAQQARQFARSLMHQAEAASVTSPGGADGSAHHAAAAYNEAWKQPYWQGLREALQRAEAEAAVAAAHATVPSHESVGSSCTHTASSSATSAQNQVDEEAMSA